MNAWDVIPPQRAKMLPEVKEKDLCAERLAGDRCLLERGHQGNHVRAAKEGRTV